MAAGGHPALKPTGQRTLRRPLFMIRQRSGAQHSTAALTIFGAYFIRSFRVARPYRFSIWPSPALKTRLNRCAL
jgi:hypothetical protein